MAFYQKNFKSPSATGPQGKKKSKTKIPEKAPELYAERPEINGKKENAFEFYKRVYLDIGYTVYQCTLKGKHGIDPHLYEGLKTYCRNRKLKFFDILPPKKQMIAQEAYKISASTPITQA